MSSRYRLSALLVATALLFAASAMTSCGARTGPPGPFDSDAGDGLEPACPPDDAGRQTGDVCRVENNHGVCTGELVCESDALVCSAREPAQDICNGVDDDCDGVADEDFLDDQGRLATLEHCGGCGNACMLLDPNATEIACDGEREIPACVVVACREGFVLVGDTLCVPEQPLLCTPCSSDGDCAASPGARCLRLLDPNAPGGVARVCAQDCAAGAAFDFCPTGFSCQSDPEGDGGVAFVDQCIPVGGTCSCEGAPDGTELPCTQLTQHEFSGEPIVCTGSSICQDGQAGACTLPEETCNATDDDCNGRIDDPYRDPTTGLYAVDPLHCGFCGNDCVAQGFPNATSACITLESAPHCGPLCLAGFFDADLNEENGCECQFQSSLDHPDRQGLDLNCDGIDGEIENSYFVAPIGSDDNPGTREAPFRTVQRGVERAANTGKRDVLVAQGVYAQNVQIRDGVHVYGGYSQDFLLHKPDLFDTVLLGQQLAAGERGAVTADGITRGATLDGFSIFGINASGVGMSTYAISIVDSSSALILSHNRIVGGVGAPGAAGVAGGDGIDGSDGEAGSDGIATSRTCTASSLGGGLGGVTQCEGTATSGGNGGESHCPRTERLESSEPCDASNATDCKNTWNGTGDPPPSPPSQGVGTAGDNGGGPGGGPTYDRWTMTNQCFLCNLQLGWPHLGQSGADGARGIDGSGGLGCSSPRGIVTAFAWSGVAGTDGSNGSHGRGGGGASAGSGFDVTVGATSGSCQDRLGGSGGGGGAGGCRGGGGAAGGAGGGSFAVWIGFTRGAGSLPTLSDNRIVIGIGGDGGAGAAGGAGGFGGLGAAGGVAQPSLVFCAESGGRGGNGGAGGHGGGGGGGCGGAAFGIAVAIGPNAFTPSYEAQNQFTTGAAGSAGPGGASLAEPGTIGQPGETGNVVVL